MLLWAAFINHVSLPLCRLLTHFLRNWACGLHLANKGPLVSQKWFSKTIHSSVAAGSQGLELRNHAVWILLTLCKPFCNFLMLYCTQRTGAAFGAGISSSVQEENTYGAGGETILWWMLWNLTSLMTHRIQWVSKSLKSLWKQNMRYRLDGKCGQCFTPIVGLW